MESKVKFPKKILKVELQYDPTILHQEALD